MEITWKFGMDHAGNPIHNEELPSGKLLGLIENRDRVFHVTDSVQQRNGRCMLGSQQSDGAQIQRLFESPSTAGRIPSVAPKRIPRPHSACWRSCTGPSAETATVDLSVVPHRLRLSNTRAPGERSRPQ